MSRERSTLVAACTDVCTIPTCIVSDTFAKWWRALWGTPVKTAAQNPCVSQIILFANAIQTPKCVSMIPNSSEHIYFYLIMTHSWHTYKSTVLISCNAIATADIMPSIVMYPPKINRKELLYSTVPPKTTRAKNDVSQRIARIKDSISSICPHFQHFDQKNNLRTY